MSNKAEKLDRISARLDKKSQGKADYLLAIGYGPTALVREGIDLLYQKTINAKTPSIPALLKSLSETNGEGPKNLSEKHNKYYKELLIEKHIG